MNKLLVIWAVLLVVGVGLVAHMAAPPSGQQQSQSTSNHTESSQADKAENRRAGCRKLMIIATESFDALVRDCPMEDFVANVANDKDASKCAMTAIVMYNRFRGKRDLETIPTDVSHGLAVACLMIKHGDTEEIVEGIMRMNKS